MPTISPSYQMKGVLNPYYTMDPSTNLYAKNALKKVGIEAYEENSNLHIFGKKIKLNKNVKATSIRLEP